MENKGTPDEGHKNAQGRPGCLGNAKPRLLDCYDRTDSIDNPDGRTDGSPPGESEMVVCEN